MITGDQGPVQQALGFVLIGRDHRGRGFDAFAQGIAVGIEHGLHVLTARHADQAGVKIGRHTGGQAAAQHEPGGAIEILLHRLLQPVDLGLQRHVVLAQRCYHLRLVRGFDL